MSNSEINNYFKNFFEEKGFEFSSFKVDTSFGKSDMPIEVLIDALTHPKQNNEFLRNVSNITQNLDFKNAPESEFFNFFTAVAQDLSNF